MAKSISSIISGAGWLASFADNLIKTARERGVPDEDIHRLAAETREGKALISRIVDIFAEASQKSKDVFRVLVDYCRSLEDMIAAGKYDSVNSDINTEHFPIAKHGREDIAIELVHIDRNISSDDALREMDKMGFRPATLPELLAFGEKYPDVQCQFPIVALGSVWRNLHGYRRVPVLWSDSRERFLLLIWFGYDWGAHYRFAAVRK